jgi:PII-like signaling protein
MALETREKSRCAGGSAFRAFEGFGRHGVLHCEHFFELAGQLTIEVEFILTDEMADRLLESLRHEHVSVVYTRLPAQFGAIGSHEPPEIVDQAPPRQ